MYGIRFDPDSPLSQYRQLVDSLRSLILDGALSGDAKLASTRELAASLKIARAVVLEAVDQLKMEGYLHTKRGSGTYVCPNLRFRSEAAPGPPSRASGPAADPRGPAPASDSPLSFAPGLPDVGLFPRRAWLSCYREAVEYAADTDLGYAPPSGRWDLRVAIASYLLAAKGIRTGPERIIVTAGSSQAFAMLAQTVPNPRIAMENPRAPFVFRVFDGLGATVTDCPVDEGGIVCEGLPTEAPHYLYVTPNHQFPLGGTLSAARRVALLEYARRTGVWIVEDDFDSEYRYSGNPVTPLAAMDPSRVVYVGSFSKTLSPALRLGFMALPPGLSAGVKTLKRRWDLWNEGFQQKALALFIARGQLERHVRHCRSVYAGRNAVTLALASKYLSPRWTVFGSTTGMHLSLRRSPERGAGARDLTPLVRLVRGRGFVVELASDYYRPAGHTDARFRDILLVGYGNRGERELEALFAAIAECDAALTERSTPR